MNADYLKEFEQMNETTESVFDLGKHELLIVLNDGTNLTSWDDVDDFNDVLYISEDFCWDDVDDFNDVLYISEDFSGQKTFSRCGSCNNVKVIVVQGYVVSSQLERVSTLFNDNFDMHFSHLESLIAFYALNCDMSRKITMKKHV